jgi:hypothetical protein
MNNDDIVRANIWNESTEYCDCCGKQSKTIWEDLADASGWKSIYFVQWTIDEPQHMPSVDIVIGPWETTLCQLTAWWSPCFIRLD